MKIPFEQTATGAYRFVFSNIVSVIGVGWLPFLLAAAVIGAVFIQMRPLFDGLLVEGSNQVDTARLGAVVGQITGGIFVASVALMFAQAMVYVGLMRKALGLHPEPIYIFFSLGSQVWQMIGSYLLLMLLLWGGVLLGAAVIGGTAVLLQKYSQGMAGLVTALLIVAAYLFAIYAIVRATFFIPAVVVAENHIGLRRAWHLGKGNFWRIIGIMFAVLLPVGFAVSTITQVIMQLVVGPMAQLRPGASPAEAQAFLSKLMDAFIKIGPYIALLEVLYVILLSGLLAGATATAYKAVTGDPAAAKAFA